MASFRKLGRNWFFPFVDSDRVRRERKGCPDRRETEAMSAAAEAANVRHGYVDGKARAYRDHEARPLADHLDDFQAMLSAKNGTGKHASVTRNRAERIIDLAGLSRVSHLSLSKALDALARLRATGLGAETINHHVRAVKAFSRWLWRDGRAREHHLAHLSISNPEGDRRRRRRALTPEVAARLVQAAERGPKVKGMTGPDRARCYSLALGTGFRASELASLTPERFDLTANPPTATVPAAYTKNGREAVQPLPAALASRLAPWIAMLPAGRPIFNTPERTAEMIRVDLAAGLDYETPSGVADFHSLRGVYISDLVASGASVKVCQTLARHSTPSLTIGLYAKASLHDIKGAVASLPDPNHEAPTPEAEAATGTDGKHSSNRRSPYFPLGGDRKGRNLSVIGGDDDVKFGGYEAISDTTQPVKMEGFDASSRSNTGPVIECRRWDLNPHEGDPSKDFKSCASAVPPRRPRSLGSMAVLCSHRSTAG
jgi:integrase/recombinase XerD